MLSWRTFLYDNNRLYGLKVEYVKLKECFISINTNDIRCARAVDSEGSETVRHALRINRWVIFKLVCVQFLSPNLYSVIKLMFQLYLVYICSIIHDSNWLLFLIVRKLTFEGKKNIQTQHWQHSWSIQRQDNTCYAPALQIPDKVQSGVLLPALESKQDLWCPVFREHTTLVHQTDSRAQRHRLNGIDWRNWNLHHCKDAENATPSYICGKFSREYVQMF